MAAKTFEIVYCPHHLGTHDSAWCTAGDHEGLGTVDGDEAIIVARRRGRAFYSGDVINIRNSAHYPRAGDVVGDRRSFTKGMGGGRFHKAYLREVVEVCVLTVVWKRPGKDRLYECSKETWMRWARGGWRCTPEGVPTRKRFWERDA